jgi:plasmid stabilization system protein ParE
VTKVVFSKTATDKLISQALYIFEQTQDIKLSDRYLDKMKAYIITTLSAFPKAGRPSEDLAPHTRKLVYQGYSIVYKIGQEHIEILTLYRENLP